jgi:hypothetical protein
MTKKAPSKTKKPSKKAPKQKDKESSNEEEEEEQNEEESSEEEEPAPAKAKGKKKMTPKKSGGKAAKPKGREVRKNLQTCKLYVDPIYEEYTYTWLDKGVEYTV